jgi:leader peptidase (prepilin peptidase)/N-methyltransferase
MELIPVASYILQRGRCRHCGAKISKRYPGVEILTGVLFYLTTRQEGGGEPLRLLLDLIFVSGLVALSFIDIAELRLPDAIVLPLLILGAAGAFLADGGPEGWEAIFSAAGVGLIFALIAWLYPAGMGWGDVKLAAALGVFLGFPKIVLAIFSGSLIGALVGGALILSQRIAPRQPLPFGPYLALGAVFALLWGNPLITFYWNLGF